MRDITVANFLSNVIGISSDPLALLDSLPAAGCSHQLKVVVEWLVGHCIYIVSANAAK